MRWLLLVAAAVCAVLLFLFSRDDGPAHRDAERPEPPSKKEYWREHGEAGGAEDAGNDETGASEPPGRLGARKFRTVVDGEITIEVTYADGKPAEGATVGHTSDPTQTGSGGPTAKTDERGVAKLHAPYGKGWFFAQRGALVAGPKRVDFGLHFRGCRLVLGDAFTIRGLVRMPDGSPAANAGLSINFWDGWDWRFIQGATTPDGTFDCRPMPLRWITRMHIYVTQRGVPRNLFEWPAATTPVELQLTRETVRGRVTWPDGRPAGDVQVNTGERAHRTDKDGRFEVSFQSRAGATLCVNKMARVLKADDKEIEIVLKPGKPLHGRLLTHDRKPVAGAWVNLTVPTGRHVASSGTDKDGRFEFLALGEGPHNLRFQVRDAKLVNAPDFFVKDVHATEKVFEVVLPRPVQVRVRLRGINGPVGDTTPLTLIVRADGHGVLRRILRGKEWFQEIPFVVWKPGTYGVQVEVQGYLPALLRPARITQTGTNEFDLELQRSRRAKRKRGRIR